MAAAVSSGCYVNIIRKLTSQHGVRALVTHHSMESCFHKHDHSLWLRKCNPFPSALKKPLCKSGQESYDVRCDRAAGILERIGYRIYEEI